MAAVDVVPVAQEATCHTSEQLQTSDGVFIAGIAKEQSNPKGHSSNTTQRKRPDGKTPNGSSGTYSNSNGHSKGSGVRNGGYIPSTVGWEDGMGLDAKHLYSGIHVDNGQHMYYPGGYGYSPHPTFCSQPPGPYISSGGAPCYGPQPYGPFYQQVVSSSGVHYYPSAPVPSEQEGSMFGSGKPNMNGAGQPQKIKPGGGGRPGHRGGHRSPLTWNGPNRWGTSPAALNTGFHDPSSGFDFPQQWQCSAHCLPPVSSFQNVPISGSCTPPMSAECGRQQAFPRVHSAPNIAARGTQGGLRMRPVKAGSAGSNWRAKEGTKHQGKGDGHANSPTGSANICTEQSPKSCITKSKSQPTALQVCAYVPYQLNAMEEHHCDPVNRTDYNKEDFQTKYDTAKFFIIKSYSEDDVHKSIKYCVWSSTPNGNKKLDEAYREAEEKSKSELATCPIFFFFSVNSSGQFCGVAEMAGSVDFTRNMDFWLQGKWNGCFPVKWHMIKDVPNCYFRHIILSNNENKPVTHSRDTQEVNLDQGMEMLKIFKGFSTRTSLLDDFAFYDDRQKVLQERKLRQLVYRQAVKQVKERPFENKVSTPEASTDEDKENGRPGDVLDLDSKVPSIECEVTGLEIDTLANLNITIESRVSVGNKQETPVEAVDDESKSISDAGSPPEGKDDLTTVIDYKKALLEGKNLGM